VLFRQIIIFARFIQKYPKFCFPDQKETLKNFRTDEKIGWSNTRNLALKISLGSSFGRHSMCFSAECSVPEKINKIPTTSPVMAPRELNACARFILCPYDSDDPRTAINELAPVSRFAKLIFETGCLQCFGVQKKC